MFSDISALMKCLQSGTNMDKLFTMANQYWLKIKTNEWPYLVDPIINKMCRFLLKNINKFY